MNFSNKALTLLLIITLIITTFSVLINLNALQKLATTAHSTDEAKASIRLGIDNFFGITTEDSPIINFGPCNLPEEDEYIIISSDGEYNTTDYCKQFSKSVISVRNTGVMPVSVTLELNKVGAEHGGEFLESESGNSYIAYKVTNEGRQQNQGGCSEGLGPTEYEPVTNANTAFPLCENLLVGDKGEENSVVTDFKILIPGDVEMGAATVQVKFVGVPA